MIRRGCEDVIEGIRQNPVHAIICAIAVIVFIFIIVAIINGIPRLSEGRVTDKTYNSAYTEYRTSSTTDESGAARTSMYPVHHPESWSIKVEGFEENGEERAEWWNVGAGLYEQVLIGDYVRRNRQTGTVSVSEGSK